MAVYQADCRTSFIGMIVKGISISSIKHDTVGITKDVVRWGTPLKPSSLKGISNSNDSLQYNVSRACVRTGSRSM